MSKFTDLIKTLRAEYSKAICFDAYEYILGLLSDEVSDALVNNVEQYIEQRGWHKIGES